MCGLFGMLGAPDRPLDLAALEAAGNALRHRGPDDEGFLLANTANGRFQSFGGPETQQGLSLPSLSQASGAAFNLGFSFRRLSIVDLSAAGHQPMSREDGAHWMVFNGEIYNHLELADSLKSVGFRFRSTSDSEVLLTAYQHWGMDCFRRFIGMWAVAIWDARERRLVLGRDQFGIKPLYFSFCDGRLVFGSELKCLLASGVVPRIVDPASLYAYLSHGRPGLNDSSLIRGIRQVPPGHVAVIDLQSQTVSESSLLVRKYWSIEEIEPREISYDAAVEEVRETFLQSMRLHLRADVPIAVNVSGGVDSSSVLMAARKILGPDVPIHAFSYIADEAFLSEEKWIDTVAKAAGAQVHKVRPDPGNLVGDMSDLLAAQDEPIGSISPYAQYRVFRLAHENGIKVTLDGQGADEYLAGYDRYHVMALATAIRTGDLWRGLRLAVCAANESRDRIPRLVSMAKRIVTVSGDAPPVTPLPLGARADYFEAHQAARPSQFVARSERVLAENLRWSMTRGLPELLRFADRNSMAFSIESRVPFLNVPLVSCVLSLPESYIIGSNAERKRVFRSAMRGLVPDSILDRRDKIGFTVPEFNWLGKLSDWVLEVLEDDRVKPVLPLEPQLVREAWLEVMSGARPYGQITWRWVNLILWSELQNVRFS